MHLRLVIFDMLLFVRMHLVFSPGVHWKMLWHILAGHCDLSFYQAKHDVMAWQHTLIPLLEISWISPSRKALCMKASKSQAQSMRPSRWGEKGSVHSGRCRMTVRNTLRQQSSGARCLSFSRSHLSLRFMGWSVFLHGERKRELFCCLGELWDFGSGRVQLGVRSSRFHCASVLKGRFI